jgi:hypothetical protein
MAAVPQAPYRAKARRMLGGGPEGNERLTSATGIVLIGLLAVIGVTLLRLRTLMSVHLFVGLLLIGPVGLKMASTGYRFARYYTSNHSYRLRGAPPMLLRVTAPVVVLSTLAVLATGVALLLVGPGHTLRGPGILRELHKLSFIVWVAFTGLHVLGHLPDIQRSLLTSDRRGQIAYRPYAAGGLGRTMSLAGAVVGGTVLAILLIGHFGAWEHAEHVFRHR